MVTYDLVPPDDLDYAGFIRGQAEAHVQVQLGDGGQWAGILGGLVVEHFGIDHRLALKWQAEHRTAVAKIVRDTLVLLGYSGAEPLPPPPPRPVDHSSEKQKVDEQRARFTQESAQVEG
jgi:hypothetical protein